MGKRLGARLIDGALLSVVLGVLGAVLIGGAASQTTIDPVTGEITSGAGGLFGAIFAYYALLAVVSLGYEVTMIALRGATIGKQLLGLKVIREADGQIPGWGPAILRWLIPLVGTLACGVGQYVVYLSPFWDNTHRFQGYHDKVAKTLVVQS